MQSSAKQGGVFVARSVELLADDGYLSFIVPMALLGDAQAKGVRRLLLDEGGLREVHAFPQKDNAAARVFPDAKLSTTLFVYQKSQSPNVRSASFVTRSHPAQFIVEDSEPLRLNSNSIRLYDPDNLTILSCSQTDWDLLESLNANRISRLGSHAEFFQGEVNETNARQAGFLTHPHEGTLVTRGACICLYQVREASQGEDIYLDVPAFTASGGPETKVHHSRYDRVVLQESSPQNNFRRIIAARLASGHFCNHTINYTTTQHCLIDLSLVLFVLNSAFAEWYFRLGSTNAHVSQYQLKMLPCPRFGQGNRAVEQLQVDTILASVAAHDFETAEELALTLAEAGCGATIEAVITELVKFIEVQEEARGVITRAQRAHLSTSGQSTQAILDKIFLTLVGLPGQYEQVRERLSLML